MGPEPWFPHFRHSLCSPKKKTLIPSHSAHPQSRLRLCLAVDAAAGGQKPHLLRPGQADLTLKLKGVDPAALPTYDQGEGRKRGKEGEGVGGQPGVGRGLTF